MFVLHVACILNTVYFAHDRSILPAPIFSSHCLCLCLCQLPDPHQWEFQFNHMTQANNAPTSANFIIVLSHSLFPPGPTARCRYVHTCCHRRIIVNVAISANGVAMLAGDRHLHVPLLLLLCYAHATYADAGAVASLATDVSLFHQPAAAACAGSC